MNKVYAFICGLFVLVITGLCGLGVVHLGCIARHHAVVAPETAGTPLPAAALPQTLNFTGPGDSGSPKVRTFSPLIIILMPVVLTNHGERIESEGSGPSQILSEPEGLGPSRVLI